MRDGVIWLEMMAYALESAKTAVGFVSDNRRDFGSVDGTALHEDLRSEAELAGISVSFSWDIATFNSRLDNTMPGYGVKWASEHIDLRLVEMVLGEWLYEQPQSFRINDFDTRDYYDPVHVGSVTFVDLSVEGIRAWDVEGKILAEVTVRGDVEADVDCDLQPFTWLVDDWESRGGLPRSRTLSAHASLTAVLSASIERDNLSIYAIERIIPETKAA